MPDCNVSSCVLNILGSFSSSLGLYKRLKEKRTRLRRAKKSDKAESEEEQRLTRSLRQGPEHISQEYHNNFCSAGDSFAIGDGMSSFHPPSHLEQGQTLTIMQKQSRRPRSRKSY